MSSPATDLVSAPGQLILELPAPPATKETPLVPVRMVNEYVYCPRLAFLEWVDGEWADAGDTEEGRRAHARVDAGGGKLPAPAEVEDKPDFVARSVTLTSEALGIIAKMDLIEGEDGAVTPVDTKKGKRPHVAEGAYEPERVQVCAQALILEGAGYKVNEGAIWYAGSRERVRIALDEDLRTRTRSAISNLRLTAAAGRLPPPLVDSPKCTKCSLAGICLPDEVTFFRRGLAPRPLNPSADTALPLYVQEPGARVMKSGEVLVVETEAGKIEIAVGDISELVLHGPISPTARRTPRPRTSCSASKARRPPAISACSQPCSARPHASFRNSCSKSARDVRRPTPSMPCSRSPIRCSRAPGSTCSPRWVSIPTSASIIGRASGGRRSRST